MKEGEKGYETKSELGKFREQVGLMVKFKGKDGNLMYVEPEELTESMMEIWEEYKLIRVDLEFKLYEARDKNDPSVLNSLLPRIQSLLEEIRNIQTNNQSEKALQSFFKNQIVALNLYAGSSTLEEIKEAIEWFVEERKSLFGK